MKKVYFILLFILFGGSIHNILAQTAPDTVFTKLYRYGKLHAYGELVIEANGGGLIVVVNANDTKSSDTSVIYLHKVDENGVKEWTAEIAAEDSALWPYSIVQTNEADGYIITGVTVSMESAYSYDYFILRTNNIGNVIWKKVYGIEDYDDIAQDIIKTEDGNYLVLGATQDAEPEPGWHLKFFTRKIDGLGATLWYKTYGNNENYSTPSQIVKISDGYILAGYSMYNQTYAFLIKLNSSGDSLFTKTFSADTFQQTWIHDIAIADNGDIFLIGNVTNTISPELYDMVLIKLDDNCNLKWTKTYDPFLGFGEVGKRICIGQNSSLYLAGNCNIDQLAVVSDIFIMKTDTSGNEVWKKEITDYEEIILNDMLKSEEDLYICGYIDISVETFPFLTKFRIENSDIENVSPVIFQSKLIITNPYQNTVNIELQSSELNTAVIEIYDIAGHRVLSSQISLISSDNQNEIIVHNIKDGLYICRCIIGDDIIVKKFIVVK